MLARSEGNRQAGELDLKFALRDGTPVRRVTRNIHELEEYGHGQSFVNAELVLGVRSGNKPWSA